MATEMTFERMVSNRKRLFYEKGIDYIFEPYIGNTYYYEKQKHILFLSYDEWAYRNEMHTNIPLVKQKFRSTINKTDEADIHQLFRYSEYYKLIDRVLKAIKSDLTAEDVAFYNFLVRPINWNEYKNHRQFQNSGIVKKSAEMFKFVIDYCNPDIIVFCSQEDHDKTNEALCGTLNTFLRERGITYLESGNLNYDLEEESEIDNPIRMESNEIRSSMGNLFVDQSVVDAFGIEDTCTYDYISLNLQQVALEHEKKYSNIPEELQKLAAFLDNEINNPGSFMQQRAHQVMKDIERDLQKFHLELMKKESDDIGYIDDFSEFKDNQFYSEAIPAMYRALHTLKALISEYEKMTIMQTIPKRTMCCTYSTKRKRNGLREKNKNEHAEKKKALLKAIPVETEATSKDRQDISAIRTVTTKHKNRKLNKLMEENRARNKRVESLLESFFENRLAITNDERIFLEENCKEYTGATLEELDRSFDDMDKNPEKFEKDVIGPFKDEIKESIRKNPNITLESLSKTFQLDENYCINLLEMWNIQQKDGRWHIGKAKK